jgi:hypothetical protein
MKKSVVMAVLGLAAAATTTVYGQGGINIGNYRGAYNQVVWDASVPTVGGQAVSSTEGVMLTLWYGNGATLTAGQLTDSTPLTWNTVAEGNGYVGYYNSVTLTLNNWTAGDTYTFQVRASGDTAYGTAVGSSALWQESANISDIAPSTPGGPPGVPGISTESMGLTVAVPEPSLLALAGLGMAGMLAMRRRRS